MVAADLPILVYRIGADDAITEVDEAWDDFALANDAPELTGDKVVGRAIMDFIADERIRHLYDLLFDQARRQQSPLTVPLRCDAPDLRRYLELTVESSDEGSLTLRSRTLRLEPREPVSLLDCQTERSDELLKICSWCKKVLVEEEWCEIEEAAARLKLLAVVPQLTHGMCPTCHDVFPRPA